MGIRKSIAVFAITLAGVLGGNAQAVTLSGATVDYSFDDTLLNALFGTFSVLAGTDTLQFVPLTWVAQINSGTTPSIGIVESGAITPVITVTAKAGYTLNGVSLYERGDYSRKQFDPGKTSYASVAGQFIVNNVAYQTKGDDVGESDNKLNHILILDDDSEGGTNPWDLEQSVWVAGISALIQVQNLVTAAVKDNLSSSFVQKKSVEISAGTAAVVPLPPAAWMLGSALVGLVAVGRRKLNV